MDVLVKWKDGSKNVVSLKELRIVGDGKISVGSDVMMWWAPDDKWWEGTALDIGQAENADNETSFEDSLSLDSEDDIPLQRLKELKTNGDKDILDIDMDDSGDITDTSLLIHAVDVLNSSLIDTIDTNYEITDVPTLEQQLNKTKAAAAASTSQGHTDDDIGDISSDEDDKVKDPDYESTSDMEPEAYVVEGEARQPLTELVEPNNETSKRAKSSEVKVCRLRGKSFESEKSARKINARDAPKPRCNSKVCESKGYGCSVITDVKREEINKAYYNMKDLHQQRQFISSQVNVVSVKSNVENSRKSKTIRYFLPLDDNGDRVRVCRTMFLNTLNIAERQVRTAVAKTHTMGIVEEEKRGGRAQVLKESDSEKNRLVTAHINRFPRMESHYCRQDTSFQYLSNELSATKMFTLYSSENPDKPVSFRFYWQCLTKMKLKFAQPKKDLCGICEGFRNSTDSEKENLLPSYEKHILEKTTVRKIKEQMKREENENHLVASFDLQQVIFLPRSNRCEVFYKRRLSCYNFSIYNIKSMQADCFLWNESIAGRGANEIASFLSIYLKG